jgi:hypothetical protein
MKTTKKQFELFKKTFVYWQKKFGLTDYRIDFFLEDIGSDAARIHSPHQTNTVTVILNNEIAGIPIKQSAKHEALHLLLNNLVRYSYIRFSVDEEEVGLAEEKLVVRLMGLIK